jgi:hypothetical protein
MEDLATALKTQQSTPNERLAQRSIDRWIDTMVLHDTSCDRIVGRHRYFVGVIMLSTRCIKSRILSVASWRTARAFSNKVVSDWTKVRNVGILAHIDAGKTTTTENLLYICGRTTSIGRVDNGDTIMDFLPQEKERGITISAAAISAHWKDNTINIIDT